MGEKLQEAVILRKLELELNLKRY